MTKTQPPPALDPTKPLPTDEVAQTYARDAARRLSAFGPRPLVTDARDPVELEVDLLFSSDVAAEAIVAESERARGTVLSRAVERVNARLRPYQQQAIDEVSALPGGFFTIGVPK